MRWHRKHHAVYERSADKSLMILKKRMKNGHLKVYSSEDDKLIQVNQMHVQLVGETPIEVSQSLEEHFIMLIGLPIAEIDWLTRVCLIKYFLKRSERDDLKKAFVEKISQALLTMRTGLKEVEWTFRNQMSEQAKQYVQPDFESVTVANLEEQVVRDFLKIPEKQDKAAAADEDKPNLDKLNLDKPNEADQAKETDKNVEDDLENTCEKQDPEKDPVKDPVKETKQKRNLIKNYFRKCKKNFDWQNRYRSATTFFWSASGGSATYYVSYWYKNI